MPACEGSWAERVLWKQPANIDKLSAAAVGANPPVAGSGLISSFAFGGLVELWRRWFGAIELEEEASLSGLRSFWGMPEAEIAELVETLGGDML
jgi:hypothetical protein